MLYLDVDNKERFNVGKKNWEQVKDLVKSIKRGEMGVHLDIKKLGIVVVDNVVVDYPKKIAILKSHLILDYRAQEDELSYNYDVIVMEDEFWTSQMI